MSLTHRHTQFYNILFSLFIALQSRNLFRQADRGEQTNREISMERLRQMQTKRGTKKTAGVRERYSE